MDREDFLRSVTGLLLAPLASACSDPAGLSPAERPEVYKTPAEWRALLGPTAFAVLFLGQTEPPGSSPLNDEASEGTYLCAACLIPLFSSTTKYETGTGWPSFWAPLDGRLDYKPDLGTGEVRTEYHCLRCGGHQGHVFDDGPPPTGKRYCNNGLALQFVPSGQPLPPPRT